MRRLDHGKSPNSEDGKRVETWTQNRPDRARRFHEWDSELFDEDKGDIENHVVFLNINFSVTGAGNNSHRKFQRIY